jgi:TonB family protein
MRFLVCSLLVVASAWPSALWAQQGPTPSTTPSPSEHAAAPRNYQPAQYARGQDQLLHDLQHAVRYPAAALRAHLTGTVRVAFTVEPTGAVDDIRIVSSPSPLLNEGIVQAVQTLGPFLPARRQGQLVRDTLTCPLVFNILAPTTANLAARPTVQILLPGLAQPLAADPARHQVVDKLVSFQDSIYVPTTKTSTVLRHTFTYDPFGRPATHTYTYLLNGRPIHSDQRRYAYRPDGQLASESNAQLKYELGYSAAGQLRELTYSLRMPSGWKVVTQTRLHDLPPVSPQQQPGLGVVIRTAGPDSLQLTYRLAYQVAPDHTITQAQLYTHAQKTYAQPLTYMFAYDTAPNPFQELFSQHWYQDQFEHQGPHNVVSKQQNGRPYQTNTYTYNAAGYPTRCVVAVRSATPTYRVQQFAYAKVVVSPAPSADLASSLSIYPNPASTTAALKALGMEPGEATVSVRQATTGQLLRQFTGQVASTRELTFSVADLPKGTYVVEMSQASRLATGRLQVE